MHIFLTKKKPRRENGSAREVAACDRAWWQPGWACPCGSRPGPGLGSLNHPTASVPQELSPGSVH